MLVVQALLSRHPATPILNPTFNNSFNSFI